MMLNMLSSTTKISNLSWQQHSRYESALAERPFECEEMFDLLDSGLLEVFLCLRFFLLVATKLGTF